MSTLLTVTDLEKFYGNRRVLDGVSFTVRSGDRVAIVGVNGSGKSTMLRIVCSAGISTDPDDQPDHGEVRRGRGVLLTYIPQEPVLDPTLTVAETLRIGQEAHAAAVRHLDELEARLPSLTGAELDAAVEEQATLHERLGRLGGWDVSHEVEAIHSELELPPMDAKVGNLSGGERRRVAIAQALLGHPDVLALDEPTNHLDTGAIAWLEGWLVARAEALLLVTHDRYFLDRVATRILELDRGKIYSYEGNYSRFLELQAERLQVEADQEDRRAAFVRRELDWIRRGPAAQMKKQQARVDRFEAAVAAKPGRDARPPGDRVMRFTLPPGPRLGRTVVEMRGVMKKNGTKLLFKDLDFALEPGERVGIVGPNGAGKSTLLRVMLGQAPPDKGEVRIGPQTRFAFLDQDRADLDPDNTVIDEVADGNDRVELPDGVVHVRTFLRWLLFDDHTSDTRIGRLSGGERNRVLLARLLRRGGNVIVLDEPTNDLDLQTLSVLEEALAEFPGCALVVSHDRWFLDKIATHLLVFEGDGRVIKYAGNYSDWVRKTGGPKRAFADTRPAKAAAPPPPPPPAAPKKLSFKEKKELEGMEAAILAAEEKVAALDAKLADPATYKSGDVRALAVELETLRAEVERLYSRWAELEARG